MDIPSSRLYEDLADAFRGELLIDPVALAVYACDASPYEQTPFVVAVPRDRDDVQTLLRYASEHHLPVIPRGAGTNPHGGAIGAGIVVDTSRFLTGIGPIEDGTIRVEAGVTLDRLNRHVWPQGWMFGPDPMTAATTTLGGMIAMNSTGARASAVGETRDHVSSLEMVLADGRFAVVRDSERSRASDPLADDLPAALITEAERLLWNPAVGEAIRNDIVTEWQIRWPRVFAGSAGTLGLFTAATLRLQPIPAARGAVLFAFLSLEAALQAVPSLVSARVAACDLFDRRLICLARESHSPWVELFPADAEAALLVEWFADSAVERTDRLNEILAAVMRSGTSPEVCHVVLDNHEADDLWTMPASLLGMLSRLPGTTRPLTILPAITVPLDRMETVVVQVQRVLQQHGVSVALHAHAATGRLHFHPLAAPPHGESLAVWSAVKQEISAVLQEHDAARGMPWDPRSLVGLLPAMKRVFDPHGVMNPSRISAALTVESDLAFRHVPQPADLQPLLLNWSVPQEALATAERCNGCGACRTQTPSTRMCPFFRAEHDELMAPRSKANALRQSDKLPADVECWETSSGQRLLDSCFNCKQCLMECPSGVDIPRLMTEMKAQYVATHGLSRANWYLTRIPDWMPWLRYGGFVFRPVLQRAWFRWLVEKLTSITRHRRFPPWRTKPFLHTAPRAWRTPPASFDDRVVVYFVDHVANWHEQEIALAAGRVLEHHGFRVHVPADQVRSGMELVTCGDIERARVLAEKNISVLGEFARAGCRIVCTEPSAAVCLKWEYPRLTDHPDAALIASMVEDIGGFLSRLADTQRFRTDFKTRAVRAAYHQPCHLRILEREAPLQRLCSLIPGVETPKIEAGCSGMAGAFGWAKENYEQSIALGKPVEQAWESVPATVALSECSSCRQQLEHLTHRRTQHPLVLLAEAYGLMPVSMSSS
ncbi:MAG TPA: FAD-binding protein [Planctomycetaceae bacterium]|nr:FAD-binding protein [Planctomycetaceae bacterium]